MSVYYKELELPAKTVLTTFDNTDVSFGFEGLVLLSFSTLHNADSLRRAQGENLTESVI